MADISLTAAVDASLFDAGLDKMKTAAAVKSRAMVSELDKIAAAEARISREAAKAARGPTGAVRGGAFGRRNVGYMGGQLAMQAQDVAVMAQMGMSTSRIIAQQGSQILSIFGTGGAIAGGVLAIGAAILSWAMGTEKAERAAKEYAANLEAIKKLAGEIGDASQQHGQALAIARAAFGEGDDAAAKLAEELRFRNMLVEAEGRLAKAKAANKHSFGPEIQAAATRMEVAHLRGNVEAEKKAAAELADLRRDAAIDNFALENEAQRDILKIEELKNLGIGNLERKAAKRKEDASRESWEAQRKWEEAAFEAQQKGIDSAAEVEAKRIATLREWETEQERLHYQEMGRKKEQSDEFTRLFEAEDEANTVRRENRIQAEIAGEARIAEARQRAAASGADSYNEIADATFGKTAQDINREERGAKREDRRRAAWERKMAKTGGLTHIKRDLDGNIISGFDPVTRKNIGGEDAAKRWRDAKKGKAAADKAQAVLAKESIDELVAAIADLLPK